MNKLPFFAAAVLALAAGCAAPAGDDAESSEDAVSARSAEHQKVERVLAGLARVRNETRLAPYYADGTRVEACWANPLGKDLSPLKKAIYCAYPLEFRLCNTIALLRIDATKVDERFDAYRACQSTVDRAFGARGLFVFGREADDVYRAIYLDADPAFAKAVDVASIVAAQKPRASGRSFLAQVGAILGGLPAEISDFVRGGAPAAVDSEDPDHF